MLLSCALIASIPVRFYLHLRGRVLLRLNRTQEAQAELTMAEHIIKEQRDTRQKEQYGPLPHPELTNVP